MLRSLIALVVAFAIAITGIAKPAYADSNLSSYSSTDSAVVFNTQGNGNSITINDGFNEYGYGDMQPSTATPIDPVLDAAVKTVEGVIGAAIACYAIDSIATLFFPPAGALSAFCPAIGTGNAVSKGVGAVQNAS